MNHADFATTHKNYRAMGSTQFAAAEVREKLPACNKAESAGCTDRLAQFIIFGRQHLDHLLKVFTAYYNGGRAHMEREHLLPMGPAPEEVVTLPQDSVAVKSHVGGLVKSFERKAA
jgi:hypothetical protein